MAEGKARLGREREAERLDQSAQVGVAILCGAHLDEAHVPHRVALDALPEVLAAGLVDVSLAPRVPRGRHERAIEGHPDRSLRLEARRVDVPEAPDVELRAVEPGAV